MSKNQITFKEAVNNLRGRMRNLSKTILESLSEGDNKIEYTGNLTKEEIREQENDKDVIEY